MSKYPIIDAKADALAENTPEYAFQSLWEAYQKRMLRTHSRYDQLCAAWCEAIVHRLEQELPGHPKSKDFDTDETIGEKAERLIKKNPNARVADVIDCVISDAVAERRVKEWQKK